MKDKIILIAMSVIVIIGVGVGRYYWGKQTSPTDKQENPSVIESSDEKDDPKAEWTGINSRDEVREKIDGTIWESTEEDVYLGRWLRFVIHDDYIDQYIATSTPNYDDPKEWSLLLQWKIEEVNEPERDNYRVVLKELNGKYQPWSYICFSKGHKNTAMFIWGLISMETNLKITKH